MNTADRLREAIESKGISYRELARLTDMPNTAIQRYASGTTDKIPIDRLDRIARVLGVNPLWLMGMDDSKLRTGLKTVHDTKRIPVLGRIACGQPISAEGNIDRYEMVNEEDISIDYALDAVGDSMIDAGIYDGDLVYIHAQETVENGEIAAVGIDGEVTLKKVFYNDMVVTLVPCNKAYAPMAFIKGQGNSIQIFGKAVGLKRRF